MSISEHDIEREASILKLANKKDDYSFALTNFLSQKSRTQKHLNMKSDTRGKNTSTRSSCHKPKIHKKLKLSL
jgi:hypothetical protein